MDIQEYIIKYLRLGYSQDSITSALLQSGYNEQQIIRAFDYVLAQNSQGNQPQTSYTPGNSITFKWGFGAVAVVGLFLIVLSVILILQNSSPAVVTPPSGIINNGNQFDQNPTSSGGSTAVSQNGGAQPSSSTGATTLNGGSNGGVTQPITNSGTSQTTGGASTGVSQGGGGSSTTSLSGFEIERLIFEIGPTDPERAMILCDENVLTAGRYACYERVAYLSENPSFCGQISDPVRRDTCYFQFAIDGLSSHDLICPNITSEVRRISCTSLYESRTVIEQQRARAESLSQFDQTTYIESRTVELFT